MSLWRGFHDISISSRRRSSQRGPSSRQNPTTSKFTCPLFTCIVAYTVGGTPVPTMHRGSFLAVPNIKKQALPRPDTRRCQDLGVTTASVMDPSNLNYSEHSRRSLGRRIRSSIWYCFPPSEYPISYPSITNTPQHNRTNDARYGGNLLVDPSPLVSPSRGTHRFVLVDAPHRIEGLVGA